MRITELAPGHEELLGYITGSAQLVYLVLSPLIGIWSDRTRSRFGRRTPFIFLGSAIGLAGLVVIGLAPDLLIVGAGWVLGMIGLVDRRAAIQTLQADQLPEQQRGKVSALTGLMTQIAPVIGIGIAYAVVVEHLPGLPDPGHHRCRAAGAAPALQARGQLEGTRARVRRDAEVDRHELRVQPAEVPRLRWNWLGRFIFFIGLYFNTTFGTFFYAQRLDLPVSEVAGVVATIGMLGVLAAAGGALAGGFLTDKLERRNCSSCSRHCCSSSAPSSRHSPSRSRNSSSAP